MPKRAAVRRAPSAAAATRTLIAWAASGEGDRHSGRDPAARGACARRQSRRDGRAPNPSRRCRPRRQKLTERSTAAEATVFNRAAARVDRYSAAAANGTAATWCELDEGYRLAPAHAGAYILPALLAEAEATGADTLQVLRALVLGLRDRRPLRAGVSVSHHDGSSACGVRHAGCRRGSWPSARLRCRRAARDRFGRRQHGVRGPLQSRARWRAGAQPVDRASRPGPACAPPISRRSASAGSPRAPTMSSSAASARRPILRS